MIIIESLQFIIAIQQLSNSYSIFLTKTWNFNQSN